MEYTALSTKPALREQSLDDLYDRLVFQQGWNKTGIRRLEAAYDVAEVLYQHDMHRDEPYIYHLVRTAIRTVDSDYLGLRHPNWAIAALHHDDVEDHPDNLIALYGNSAENELFTGNTTRQRRPLAIPIDPFMRQRVALQCMRHAYGSGVSRVIAGLTNPPNVFDGMTNDEKLQATGAVVASAITDPQCFPVKFSDWDDHPDGEVIPGSATEAKLDYYHKKNREIAMPLARRFVDADVQILFGVSAKHYISSRLQQVRYQLAT
jgi:hypothetical protein